MIANYLLLIASQLGRQHLLPASRRGLELSFAIKYHHQAVEVEAAVAELL